MQSEIREINRFVSVFYHDNQSARLSLLNTIDSEIQFLEGFDLTTIINPDVKWVIDDELSIKNLIFHLSSKRDRGTFSYTLTSRADKATIVIYNLRGKKVRTITDASSRSGYNEYTWLNDDDNYVKLANGVYIYKITVEKDQKKIQAIGKLAIIR